MLVRPSQAWVEVAASRGLLAVAGAYFKLGIEHILFGVDHLLFILGLLLIVKDRWMLVKTVSSFTVAHSITLAIATLGYARAPEPPLTAAIALSILFLGPEIVRSQRGETSLTIRHPWVVAFAFGLLHGFGFASGLTTMGLPRAEIPLALLLFNLGVEAGQLLFVIVVLLLERSFRMLEVRLPRRARSAARIHGRLPGSVLDDSACGHHARRRTMKGTQDLDLLDGLVSSVLPGSTEGTYHEAMASFAVFCRRPPGYTLAQPGRRPIWSIPTWENSTPGCCTHSPRRSICCPSWRWRSWPSSVASPPHAPPSLPSP